MEEMDAFTYREKLAKDAVVFIPVGALEQHGSHMAMCVDAALTNGGGIREALAKGDISKKSLLAVFPFGNTVATIDVTGAQLLEALEAATCTTPEAIGAFPQVSGIEFTLNTGVPYVNGTQPRHHLHGERRGL